MKNIIETYAQNNYKKMFREPEGQLEYKFIVPGSVYGNQLWDWDSWLTNVALRQFVTEDIGEYEKGCVLNFLDHIDDMEQLRQGIGLQAYGQRDPLVEYKMSGYDMFDGLTENIRLDTVRLLLHLSVQKHIQCLYLIFKYFIVNNMLTIIRAFSESGFLCFFFAGEGSYLHL